MDDTISRQAAIDALNDEFTITGKTNAIAVQDYIRRVNNRLRGLPSAQPEQRWISVSEKLPDEAGIYLVTISYGAIRKTATRWYSTAHGWEWVEDMPIAWMPLPEPYRPE